MIIHREGHNIILTTLFILSIIGVGIYMIFPWLLNWLYVFYGVEVLLFLFIIAFFRSPKRKFVKDNSKIISPADGKVVVIEKVNEKEYLDSECIQISVFMSVWNVHLNRVPCSGTVKFVKYKQGAFHMARHPKASMLNEMSTTLIEADNGKSILIKQIAGAVARRISTYIKPSTTISQFDELGFIRFGSRVDILVPLSAEIVVKQGQKVKGGLDTLAIW